MRTYVEYHSNYVEIAKLDTVSSSNVVIHLKSILAMHCIPETVVSNNGPQFAAQEFVKFADDQVFTHITSSPRYRENNGKAERAVQTVKNLLKKSADPYNALLSYRATPLECGYSPSQLLMGRQVRSKIPVVPTTPTQDFFSPVIPSGYKTSTLLSKTDSSRSYLVRMPTSCLRRN